MKRVIAILKLASLAIRVIKHVLLKENTWKKIEKANLDSFVGHLILFFLQLP